MFFIIIIIYLISKQLVFFQSFGLSDFRAVFFDLSLFFFFFFFEFLLISESYLNLLSSRTTIVLLGIHNLANSMKIFVNNKLA